MRIGLASYRSENRNTAFNISQIERALKEAQGKVDLLCFGEAFLQGFDSLDWKYETDKKTAVAQDSETMNRLRCLTVQYHTALLTGYIEREGDTLYSSSIVLAEGKTVHNYRRISRGWKDFTQTDDHYREGTETGEFSLQGKKIMLSLCGDMWDFPERFKTDHLLIWPIYVNYTLEDWEAGTVEDYAAQSALAAKDALLVNPLDNDPVSHGGAFRFQEGRVTDRIPFDSEQILIVDVE